MFLTIENGKLVLLDGEGKVTEVTSIAVFDAAAVAAEAAGGGVLCSSSVDFPHEYTSDPVVIALAHAIRGH